MQKTVKMIGLLLALALSVMACNLPFMATEPAVTPAPTDAGFQAPTAPVETVESAIETPAGEPAAEDPAAEPTQSGAAALANTERLTLATTDSLANSGLLAVLVDGYRRQTGYDVKLELGGAGRAFRLGEKFVADVLLVNDPDDEIAYMNAGHGKDRTLVMHTDYIIVGPEEDPAGIKNATDAVDAFKKIAGASAPFITREAEADEIRLEKDLWRQAGITPSGSWYVAAADAGPVGVLRKAFEVQGYALIDRPTFLSSPAKDALAILFEGDVELYDAYHLITHDPAKSPKINDAAAQAFVQYLLAPETQEIIAQYGVDTFGQPVFFPDAGKPE